MEIEIKNRSYLPVTLTMYEKLEKIAKQQHITVDRLILRWVQERLTEFTEQITATIRGSVKDIATEIVSGSLGVSIQNLVDKYNAGNVLVYSHSNQDDLLDAEVDILARLVQATMITIIWE